MASAFAQAPALLWATNVGAAHLVAVDQTTNVYVSTNGTVIQLNSSGVPIQTNIVNQGPGLAQRDSDGNFYFAGVRPAFNYGSGYDYGTTNACFLAKYTPSGSLIWSNGFGPTGLLKTALITDLQLLTNGDIYVGFAYSITTVALYSSAAKFDNTGSNIWTMGMPNLCYYYNNRDGTLRLGNLSSTNGYALTYANNGAYYTWKIMLSRFGSDGIPTIITNWTSTYDYRFTPPPIFDSFGNFYTQEGAVTKRDPSGNIVWQYAQIPGTWPVGADFYGGVHMADTQSNLTRVDSDGNPVWTKKLPSNCREMLLDSSGNRFVSFTDGSIGRLGGETLAGVAITNSLQPMTVLAGSDAVFSVGVSGFSPLRYYWFFNGTLVPGQTNSTLTLPSVTLNQAGSYCVIVSNLVNSVTRAPVQLRIQQVALFIGGQILTNGNYIFATNPVITVRSTFANGSAFYTLDGSAPNFSSTIYSGPFPLYVDATIRAIGYSADFSQSEEVDSINATVLAHHSLAASSSGGGSITLNPPGGDYLSSAIVNATAVPDAGWTFLYWTGDASGSSSSLDVSMHNDQSIHAIFGTTLSTTVQGNGQILLYPPGGLYSYGQVVRLTGVPQPGSYFGFWGNATTGNANPLYFTVTNANPTISSIFGTNAGNQSTLTVLISGRGIVNASPQANVYTTGQSVTLTAVPDAGQTFVNWSGNASGSQNPLNIVLDQNKTVTANFSGGPALRVRPELGEGMHLEGFRFSLLSDPDSIYEIRCSTNLTSWESVGYVTNHLGEAQLVDPDAVNHPKKFYRFAP
jgi:Divergent InlB B-repeat domain/Chitobiase/beta-hexosaminidase C-terminal domain